MALAHASLDGLEVSARIVNPTTGVTTVTHAPAYRQHHPATMAGLVMEIVLPVPLAGLVPIVISAPLAFTMSIARRVNVNPLELTSVMMVLPEMVHASAVSDGPVLCVTLVIPTSMEPAVHLAPASPRALPLVMTV